MRILLPPSEGKTAPQRGRPVSKADLSFPELNGTRRMVLRSLIEVSARDDALKVLGVGASLTAEVERNTRLLEAPAAPAAAVYSGVLYEALGMDSLSGTALRRARESIVVISAAFGALTMTDRIPAYRLSMGTKLPGIGALTGAWREPLVEGLAAHLAGQVIVDCRSASYQQAMPVPPGSTYTVRVFTVSGESRSVVSHSAKKTRGELARHLVTRSARPPRTGQQLLIAAQEVWEAELITPSGKKSGSLDILLPG